MPGTRRARRQAERRRRTAGALGIPGGVVKAMRLGVLGAVVIGTGAFTVSQVAADPQVSEPTHVSALEAGTLNLRDGGAEASRSQAAGRLALEAEGGVTFTVKVDGQTREITTTAADLGEALAEADIVIGKDDVVSASLSGPVPAGETVEVDRARLDHVTEEKVDEYKVVEEEDPNLPEGEREVEREGQNGVTTTTFRVLTAGDDEISRQRVATVVESERVDELVRVGTMEPVQEPPTTSESTGSESSGSDVPEAPATYSGDPRSIARSMLGNYGWGADQFSCLDSLWQRESGWNPHAENPSSGAYGIPQALPGSKMATAGSDWATNPATQIEWGLGYISARYGSPCGAWAQSQSVGWY
ncbi:G5 domain-containing protein [Georgenia halophila]|uniref:aggregation-promoting factor C-terminal-like domain-containing protein n=1 Tax=Georgenia halophila TaxID=620889 RepID=UPI0031EC68BE